MTNDTPNEDGNTWLSAQFADTANEDTASESSPQATTESQASDREDASGGDPTPSAPRRPISDADLPLRRPVIASSNSFTWGLTPSTETSNDAESDDVEPEPVNAEEGDATAAPAVPVRPYFPEPVAAEPAVAEPAAAEPTATDTAADDPNAAEPAAAEPAAAEPTAAAAVATQPETTPVTAAPSEIAALTAAIPTIQEVLDSPSPRRAAREAAAKEAALREATARGGTPLVADSAAADSAAADSAATDSAATDSAATDPYPSPAADTTPRTRLEEPSDDTAPFAGYLGDDPVPETDQKSTVKGSSLSGPDAAETIDEVPSLTPDSDNDNDNDSDNDSTAGTGSGASGAKDGLPTLADIAALRASRMRTGGASTTPPLEFADPQSRPAGEDSPRSAVPASSRAIFDLDTPLVVDDGAPGFGLTSRTTPVDGTGPGSIPGSMPLILPDLDSPIDGVSPVVQPIETPGKNPRNQRLVLLVLIGLAAVLVTIVAVNLLN